MVMRLEWLESVNNNEPAVMDRADYLLQTSEHPGDVRALAQRLGATIVQLRDGTKTKGYLSGEDGDWTVMVKGDIIGDLNKDQRFTVAHELAHLLFLERRMVAGPCSKNEYWLL